MRIRTRYWGLGGVLTAAASAVLFTALPSSASDSAQHVRWDIITLIGVPPGSLNPGGHASATAPEGGDTITLTGSGTFVAPVSGTSSAATGGGTWTTSSGGSGTYTATGLVSWVNAGPQTPATPPLVDNIDHGTRVNGTAVLRIAFSDGSDGVLTLGCHGTGAPPGIFEGIATTKGYKTYYEVPDVVPGVDAGRTNFHVS
jgi:hypothetical protein